MPRPRTVDDAAVLAATLAAVARVGPARLTLADVGRDVGLSPATLLQRFGSKRGLLLAAARASTDLEARFAIDAPSRLTALTAGLVRLSAAVATPEAMANSLAFLQLDLADADFHAEALAGYRALRRQLERLLREALDGGELRAGTDVAALAEAVQTAYNGALIAWAIHREGPLATWLERQVEAVLGPHRA